MPWLNLEGHDDVVAKFRSALAAGRLANTFLFVGPEGIGKRTFAVGLAQSLLCETRDELLLDPCGECPGCVQVIAGTHPDFLIVARPPGKSFIPLGLFKGDEPDYPVRQSLLCNLALRSFAGKRKIAVIDDADYLNQEGANCLLKTLEEPPARSVMILIGTSADRQLPTIRSRAQLVRFRPLEKPLVAKLLVQNRIVADAGEAGRLAAFSGGSLSRAVEMVDPALWAFRSQLLTQFAKSPLPSVDIAQSIVKFVDEAGKEASARRARLRLVIGFVADFWRHLIQRLAGVNIEGDVELVSTVDRAAQPGNWSVESTTDACERTLDALNHVDRNANQNTLAEAWLDDLATIANSNAVVGKQ
jgi:DNA polymerase III subunit delta'